LSNCGFALFLDVRLLQSAVYSLWELEYDESHYTASAVILCQQHGCCFVHKHIIVRLWPSIQWFMGKTTRGCLFRPRATWWNLSNVL